MNEQTHSLIERPYQELVDDLLTALVGGVVNEPVVFDLKADLYPLAEPAAELRGITGTVEGTEEERHSFLQGVDFELHDGAVVWLQGGEKPRDESTFHVDYLRRTSRSPLTDVHVGSVTRTLAEAIGREIATVYRQINLAYLAAFLDTAAGKSLDLVVSILGVRRKRAEHAEGMVSFFRDPNAGGNVNIPEATRLFTAKGEVRFESTEPRTLQRGQARIDVPVRAGEGFAGEAGLVAAGAITRMAQPVAGIARVSNVEVTLRAAGDETDDELRLRAKAALRSLGKATLAALDRVIREGRGTPIEIWDPSSPANRTEPGTVSMLVEAEPERFPGLRAAVEQTRAAGVVATLVARYVFFKPRLVAGIAARIAAAGKDKIKRQVVAAVQGYVDGLSSGDRALGAEMLDAVKRQVKDLSEPRFTSVLTWRSDVGGGSSTEALVETLADAAAAVPGSDEAALRVALGGALAKAGPAAPTGRRLPDLSLVQSLAEATAGAPASVEEIASGEFQVAARIGGESWWVYLDLEPADVTLEES